MFSSTSSTTPTRGRMKTTTTRSTLASFPVLGPRSFLSKPLGLKGSPIPNPQNHQKPLNPWKHHLKQDLSFDSHPLSPKKTKRPNQHNAATPRLIGPLVQRLAWLREAVQRGDEAAKKAPLNAQEARQQARANGWGMEKIFQKRWCGLSLKVKSRSVKVK